ncbi:MAG: hypothetical protein EBR82_18895 [Caulobacteraceae bacterium]|nr:hypothetical protein [Caulobacteraceae bacterium]
MAAKPSRYAAALDAALGSADQIADRGISGEAQNLYNALWTEQGGKLEDQYSQPWEEMRVAVRDGDRGTAIRAATEFLLAIEFGFFDPNGPPPGQPGAQPSATNDSSVAVDSVRILRD